MHTIYLWCVILASVISSVSLDCKSKVSLPPHTTHDRFLRRIHVCPQPSLKKTAVYPLTRENVPSTLPYEECPLPSFHE